MKTIDRAERVINYESPGLDARLILADHLPIRANDIKYRKEYETFVRV